MAIARLPLSGLTLLHQVDTHGERSESIFAGLVLLGISINYSPSGLRHNVAKVFMKSSGVRQPSFPKPPPCAVAVLENLRGDTTVCGPNIATQCRKHAAVLTRGQVVEVLGNCLPDKKTLLRYSGFRAGSIGSTSPKKEQTDTIAETDTCVMRERLNYVQCGLDVVWDGTTTAPW